MEALQWKLSDNPKVSIPEIPIFRPELCDRTGLNLVFGPVFWASTNTTSQKPYHYARLEPNQTARTLYPVRSISQPLWNARRTLKTPCKQFTGPLWFRCVLTTSWFPPRQSACSGASCQLRWTAAGCRIACKGLRRLVHLRNGPTGVATSPLAIKLFKAFPCMTKAQNVAS